MSRCPPSSISAIEEKKKEEEKDPFVSQSLDALDMRGEVRSGRGRIAVSWPATPTSIRLPEKKKGETAFSPGSMVRPRMGKR